MKIILAGSQGRMGKSILKNLYKYNIEIFPFDKKDQIPNIKADVFIDFSYHDSVLPHIEYCKKNNIPFLTGVTGFSNKQLDEIKEYSKKIPVFLDYNMSFGINAMLKILNLATKLFSDYDIEILETHHVNKKDSPSGTAIKIFNEINQDNNYIKRDIKAQKNKEKNEIGIHSIRSGAVFGEHKIIFANELEEINLHHKSYSRDNFAIGAIKAALWLSKQKVGFYNMKNYLDTL